MNRRFALPLFFLATLSLFVAACAPLSTPPAALTQPPTQTTPVPPSSPTTTPPPTPVSTLTSPATIPVRTPTAVSQPAPAAARTTDIKKVLGIAYTSIQGVDSHLLSLDIYYSEPGLVKRPVLLYVHGGGWTGGDKSQVNYKPEFFVKAGYVFLSVNYRLSPAAKFPAHVQDIAAAIDWTLKNIGPYGGDPSRLYLMGHSAGGHLAALVATDPRYLQERGLSLLAIKGVVVLDTAAYDLSVFAGRCKNHLLPEPYNIPFGEDPAEWKLASPETYVAANHHIPPMALIYSGDVGIGSTVLREQMATEFATRLKDAGIRVDLFGDREKNHADINTEFGAPGDSIAARTLEFLGKTSTNPG